MAVRSTRRHDYGKDKRNVDNRGAWYQGMTDRPIIFSGPMVRALLESRKTQTRRLASSPLAKCKPGDRLYVRESLTYRQHAVDRRFSGETIYEDEWLYAADGEYVNDGPSDLPRRGIPSIHMPRWASRLTLVVIDVRFQRLQDISEADALAEGVDWDAGNRLNPTARIAFANLWDSLHKPPHSWDDNPGIVALTFAVHHCNIYQMEGRY